MSVSRAALWHDRGVVAAVDTVTGPAAAVTPARTSAVTWAFRAGLALLAAQFAFLCGYGWVDFHRMTLGVDFGIFSQAWTQIGSGHLDPTSSISDIPYLRSHFELLMWPLALLHPLVHSPMVLLVVQAAALSATGVVVLVWVRALLARSPIGAGRAAAVLAGTVLLLVVNPVVYATATEDFHFEPLAACFAVLAAYDLWSGRTVRLWVWVALCLACGDVGGLYVVGVGLTGVAAARGDRVRSAVVLAAGAAWVGLIAALGDNVGSNVSVGYAYLAGRTTLPSGVSGLALVVGDMMAHPWRPWDLVTPRFGTIVGYLQTGGVFGAFTPWGFGVPLVALGSAALQHDPVFIRIGFQNVVVSPFVTFGTAWLVVWLLVRSQQADAGRWPGRRALVWTAAVVGVVALASGGIHAARELPPVFGADPVTGLVPAGEAAALRAALAATPPDAEVVAPVPTIGRFGQRPFLYVLVDPTPGTAQPLPVRARTVVVVVDSGRAGQLLPPAQAERLVARLVGAGARVVVHRAGVTALVWHPPPGTTALYLP
jgi:hypothetical protein